MYEENSELQRKVLSGIAGALGVIVLGVIYLNLFVNHFYTLAFIEALFCLASFALSMAAAKNKHKRWQVILYLISLMTLIAFALLSLPFLKGVFFWIFCLPVIFYIIIGTKIGFIFSFISMAGAYAVYYIKTNSTDLFFMHQSGSVNFISSYLAIWVVSHLYEDNRQKKEASLYRLANTDIVTGAKNRLAFKNRCEQLAEQNIPFVTILIDIDYFKKINDLYGHNVGDGVLNATAKCIAKAANCDDVFRYGGEEFCVLCVADESEIHCTEKAEKIRAAIQDNHISIQDHDISVTASIGLAAYDEDKGLEAMFALAEDKMYEAKQKGRNQVTGYC